MAGKVASNIIFQQDYNGIGNGRNSFDQPIKNDLRTYDNIRNNAVGQGADWQLHVC